MKLRNKIFISPVFIIPLVLLIINDFLLKPVFHNIITGKISDFAGLFIFPLFWSVFFFNKRKYIYIFTFVFFVFWKSPLSQSFIDFFNSIFVFNISRSVDFSDLIALVSLPFSYLFLNKYIHTQSLSCSDNKRNISLLFLKKILINTMAVLAIISFCATSYHKNFEFNKLYSFGFNGEKLIEKINLIQNTCNNLPLSTKIQNSDSIIYNGNDTSYISFNGYNEFYDTIFKYDKILKKKTNIIDTVIHHKYPKIDTIFIKNNQEITYKLSSGKYFSSIHKNYCDCVDCHIRLSWKNDSSYLKLNYIYTSNCYGMFDKTNNKKEKNLLLEAFEKEIIIQLKK